MRKKIIAGLIVSFAMTGVFGGISFAADRPSEPRQTVGASARVEAPAGREKRSFRKRSFRKRDHRRAVAKRSIHHKRHIRYAR